MTNVHQGFEAEHLKNEIEYLSRLIHTHKAISQTQGFPVPVGRPYLKSSPNLRNVYQRKAPFKWNVQSSPPILQKRKNLVFIRPNTLQSNNTSFTQHNDTAKVDKNPYKIVKPLLNVVSKSPSKIANNVYNQTPSKTIFPDIKIEKTPLLLKSKYKLVKNRNGQMPIRNSFVPQQRAFKQSPRIKRKHVVNKFKVDNKLGKSPKIKWPRKSFQYNSKFSPYQNQQSGHRYSYFNAQNKIKFYSGRNYYNRNAQPRFNSIVKKSPYKKMQVVSIGGLFYRASKTKLSRTITPKQKNIILNKSLGSPKIISVGGVKYKMDRFGKTLKRLPNSDVANKSPRTPITRSRIDLGGSTYVKSPSGVFIKSSSTEARVFASRAINRSIQKVHSLKKLKQMSINNVNCMFYTRFGKCHKRETCKFVHDPEKVAVCTRFLRGTCKTETCPFLHKISPDKMTVCSYFLQGRCSSDNCPYRHVKVNPEAEVCKDFVKGFCAIGLKCKKLHILDCPQYLKNGICENRETCILKHIKQRKRKLSEKKVLRRNAKLEPVEKKKCVINSDEFPSFISLKDIQSPEEKLSKKDVSHPLSIRPQFLQKVSMAKEN